MNAEEEGRVAAGQFRREHRLGTQPLGDLVALIEQVTGFDVAVLDVGPDEHGLTMRDPKGGAVFIGVARTRKPMRQRSTLAHELGHVRFEDWIDSQAGDWAARRFEEIRADAFARHLLVPKEGLLDFLGDRGALSVADLSAVVQRFVVSPSIAAIALHDAGYIDVALKREWMNLSTPQLAFRFGWIDHYRALQADSQHSRAPQRLLTRAITAYAEGVLSVQAVANLRGIPAEDAKAELDEAGMTPAERPIAWSAADDLPDVDVDLSSLDELLNALDPDGDPANGTAKDDG
ncbi:ImmA/IrrE family metallo-endopeptidase [Streptomonospora sp. PA3]|uniref:ImmA/IrrE family metallo-endopeptidase n=1 Tax=Streptomonospora sp. PA3 TaxID=2607326 RepID=UPI0012DD98C6|nr:ImmA/IrrE family metallo-endopeptidase [Streptomonospora sp. PA3]MUL42063.1 ImmA/IrrE family metallo-endopeptidase [Streptomonospora sp. PA3]